MTVIWRGDAPAVAQVDTLTIGGTVEVGDVFTATINGKTLTYVATSTTLATEATAFAAAWNASTIPEFAECTAAATSGGALTLTADTAGKPFTATVATTESGGGAADAQTFVRSATTANSGPNVWDVAANWSGAAVPVNSDDVVFENNASDVLYGLAQSAVTLTSLTIRASYTGKIGLPKINADGSSTYYEYRADYLAISATTINVGQGVGNGSSRMKINVGTIQTTVNVFLTGSAAETGYGALIFKGTHASNAVNLWKGSVSVAPFAGETAVVVTLNVGFVSNRAGDSWIHLGSGVTLTTVNQDGGTVQTDGAFTTANQNEGTHDHRSGAITTWNLNRGTAYYQGTGTLGTLIVGDGGVMDFGRDMRGRTVSAADIFPGATIKDPFGTVTWTAGIDVNRGSLADVKIDVGSHRRYTPGAVA